MMVLVEGRHAGRVRRRALIGAGFATCLTAVSLLWPGESDAGQLPASAFQAYNPADAASIQAGPFALYTVPVASLAATQMNLGFAEVNAKTAAFNLEGTLAQLDADLITDIEPVVIGPGGVLYQTDGHHTFRALLDSAWGASDPNVYVNVIANFSNLTTAQFWAMMEQENLVYPVNDGVLQNVNFATGAPLPGSLLGMTSDVYRGLEYSILKNKSSKLFKTAANITGAIGATTPGLDKTAAFYSDFIWADAYRDANDGLGLPYLSPGDIALATKWNLTGTSTTTLPNVGTVTVAQLPGYILPSGGNITITGTVSNATLANGTLDGSETGTFDEATSFASFNGLRGLDLGPVTIGANAPGFVMQLGNDLGGTVTLSGTNTYTGGTTILAGTLIITGDASLGAASPANPAISLSNITGGVQAANGIVFNSLTEGNGTIQLGATASPGTNSFSTNRPIAVDGEVANINLNGNTLTLTGQLYSVGAISEGISNATGEGDLTIEDNSSNANGTLILAPASGSNPNFFGDLIISSGTLRVSSDAAMGNTSGPSYEIGQIELNGGTFQAGASFNSVRSLFLAGGSTYDTNGFATAFAGSMTDVQRTLTVENSNAGAAGAVTFGSFAIGSTATLALDAGTGTTGGAGTMVTFTNGITRNGNTNANAPANATLFIAPSTGSTLGSSAANGVEVFSSGASTTLTNGIAPVWIITDSGGGASTNPYNFVTYNATNGYEVATYTQSGSGSSGGIRVASSTDIVNQTGNATLAANANAFALKVDDGAVITATGHTLTIGDGTDPAGLIMDGGGAGITGGTLAFGASEAVIDAKGSSTISSTITGTGGLTLSGSGTLTLSGPSGPSGPVVIDSGQLTLTTANYFPTTGAGTNLWLSNVKKSPSPAILAFNQSQTIAELNSDGNNSYILIDSTGSSGGSTTTQLTVGDATDQVLSSSIIQASTTSNTSNPITPTGTAVAGIITKAGSGLLDISGASVSLVTGSTVIVNDGALRIGNGVFSTTSTNGIVLNNDSELQYSGNGGSVFNNPISGNGVFHVLAGTVQLTGTNTYTGGTVVESGAVLDTTTANLPSGGNIINAGGTVVFDQNTNGTFTGVISDGQASGGPNNPNSIAALASGAMLSGSLIKDDSSSNAITASNSNLTLGAVQTYSGSTTVEAGTLTLGVANAIANSSGVDLGRVGGAITTGGVAQTATLALGANNLINGLSSEAANATFVQLNSYALTVNEAGGNVSTFGGAISDSGGAGTLVKQGAGMLVLNGTSSVGNTTVGAGTLAIGDINNPGASLTSTVAVGSAGTLIGHGTVIGAVANNGTVAPGGTIGTLSINGSYTQAPSATLAIELNPTTSSALAVSGTPGKASLAGTLSLLLDAGSYARGTSYTVLTASGGVSGSFGTVTSTNASLVFTPVYEPDAVDLTLSSFAYVTQNAGEQTWANAFNNAPVGSPLATLGNVIGNLPASEQAQAIAQAASHATTATTAATVTSMQAIQGVLSGRATGATPQLPGPQSAAADPAADASAPLGPFTMWTQGLGEFGTVQGDSNAPGFSSSVGGIAAGLEAPVDIQTRVGVALGYISSSISVTGMPQNGSLDAWAAGLYAGRRVGGFLFDGNLAAAYDRSTTMRVNSLTDGSTSNGSADGYAVGLGAGVSHPLRLAYRIVLEPRFGFDYDHDHQVGFTEAGGNFNDLQIAPSDMDTLRTTLGTRLSRGFVVGDGGEELVPALSVGWGHEWLDAAPKLVEDGVTTLGVNPGRDAALLGTEVSYNPRAALSLYLRYDATLSERETDQAVRGGIRFSW
jgi:autotransporter-associated beta strand protein